MIFIYDIYLSKLFYIWCEIFTDKLSLKISIDHYDTSVIISIDLILFSVGIEIGKGIDSNK